MKERWNERYSNPEYAYGEQPNNWLKQQLDNLNPGKILFPAEGEGRNAVYAAKQGWQVSAFDLSEEGKKKADLLATKNHVSINYTVGEFSEIGYPEAEFDAIALIYAHFPANKKSGYHKMLNQYLKVGGTIIFEAFGKGHLPYRERNPAIGGPNELDMLFSEDEIKADFQNFEILVLKGEEVELNEGLFHNGTGWIIRFVGRKLG